MRKKRKSSNNTGNIVRIDSFHPDPDSIAAAAQVLRKQGLLVFPTSGLYGLGGDALHAGVVRRIYDVKCRSLRKPLLVLISDVHEMKRVVRSVPAHAKPLLALWPGDITLIFHAWGNIPQILTGETGKIGVRVPAHPVARSLVEAFGGPIVGTSANLSGSPAVSDLTELSPEIQRETDIILDGGILSGGVGSTIVDATCHPVRVLREGRVSKQVINDIMTRTGE